MPDPRSGRLGKPVSIAGLSKSYGSLAVLHDIGLDIEAGEFCTLLGASGSGKTTLLKIVAGFEPFEAGRLEIDGRDIGHVPVARRNIGMVFQNYALFPHMTVRRNVAFGLEMRRLGRGEIDRRVDEALDLVSLTDFRDRLPRALSGGQQQRVALARALVINPDILLMDEPLGALDKNLRQSIQLQLKSLHRQLGVTIIYVTHDQEEALNLSDRIVILDRGRIVQNGTPRELYFRPVNPFVASFLGECNFLEDDQGRQVAIRPENVEIAGPEDPSGPVVEAQVEALVFLGATTKIVARRGPSRIVAVTSSGEEVARLRTGQEVRLALPRRHMIRFPAD